MSEELCCHHYPSLQPCRARQDRALDEAPTARGATHTQSSHRHTLLLTPFTPYFSPP